MAKRRLTVCVTGVIVDLSADSRAADSGWLNYTVTYDTQIEVCRSCLLSLLNSILLCKLGKPRKPKKTPGIGHLPHNIS